MPEHPIVHVDIPGKDPEATGRFYANLFGWQVQALPAMRYTRFESPNGVTGGFVDDVRRRRVFDVMDLAHVAGDHQDFVSLKFPERRGWNESVHGNCAPLDLGENIVHLLNARDSLE